MTIGGAMLGWLLVNAGLTLGLVLVAGIYAVLQGVWQSHVSRWLGRDLEVSRRQVARQRAVERRRLQEADARDSRRGLDNDARSPY